jgi:hypothetical protein
MRPNVELEPRTEASEAGWTTSARWTVRRHLQARRRREHASRNAALSKSASCLARSGAQAALPLTLNDSPRVASKRAEARNATPSGRRGRPRRCLAAPALRPGLSSST